MKLCLVQLVAALALCLGSEASAADNPTFSPDSSRLAFTVDGDLYVKNIASGDTLRLSFDASSTVRNAYASWVYYEEIFGRSTDYKAFWWSPDSRKLAWYRFDESGMEPFVIYSAKGQYGSVNATRYPKAGTPNPKLRILVADLETGEVTALVDSDADEYYGTPFWGADSRELYLSRMPRRQNSLELFAVSTDDGSFRTVYRENYPTWIDWINGMLFSDKGLYMVRSFESGWQQIYSLSFSGRLECLTSGRNWDMSLLKYSDKHKSLWVKAKRDSRLHPGVYRLDLGTGKFTALTDSSLYAADVSFSDDCKTFTATLSNCRTPKRKCVFDSFTGAEIEVLEEQKRIEGVPEPHPVVIHNEGYELYGLVSLPENFDTARRYPVVMQLYGGPGTPYVHDSYRSRDSHDDWCYKNGIIYAVVDPRSSGENGRRGVDEAFGRMTVNELRDYIAWAGYFGSLPYVDSGRIGVEGFSFGGTTTAMLVLRYPEYFRCGIAGGGVYDWTLYDSHYTERYMDTPQSNPDGYREASVISCVRDSLVSPLYRPGSLMLTHGTGDDNVHFQNTLQLVDALQEAGVKFRLMIYPDGKHGYRKKQWLFSQESDHDFWKEMLLCR